MLQNDTYSVVDSRMVIAAECLSNPAFQGTKDDVAREAGISRATLYRWLRNDDFIKLVNQLIDKYVDAERGMVWKALSRECGKGNMAAIKLFFDLTTKTHLPEDTHKPDISKLYNALESEDEA